ncbi:MAG TPA: biotin transporter BioY [Acidimicrobiia bacterium]|jgi:biotin transport system substrate-specific component
METFAPTVLTGRVLPRSRVAAVIAVVGFAALTAAAAQYRIPLGFTPVPITGSTFAVLLSGAALGMRLGAASQILYVVMGAVGLPVFTDGGSGVEAITGSTGGYLIGFVFGAAAIGKLAERKQDRHIGTMVAAFLAGTSVIYAFGVAGLMVNAGMDFNNAVLAGVAPFVFGDVLKAAAAGILLPATWRLLGDH